MFQVNPLLCRRFTQKNQALFSLKDKSKKLKCHLLQFLFGASRVKSLLPMPREVKMKMAELISLTQVFMVSLSPLFLS